MAQKKSSRQEVDDEIYAPLQAVLLADSFTQRFRPITLERPKVLLPLANVPMIDYTLEWLASAGVEEVFVFCCSHSKQVTSYLEQAQWMSRPNFAVTTIESRDCVSVGDALRSIDQSNVVRSDFVLVSGDTISNMPLKEILQQHKARRKKDKLAVMTMVVKRAKSSPHIRQTRLGTDELTLVIDPDSKQLLHYDQRSSTPHVVLDKGILMDRPAAKLCVDMQDCHIDICSPEVLMLFTDNFDYQQLRRDFVRGILSDEVMGNKVYTYEISEAYAARVDNFRSYDTVSKDVLKRWTYPLVPDIPFSKYQKGAKLDRCNKYREQGAVVARTAVIGENTQLGEGSVIGENSKIYNSVIGRDCRIGENVVIEGSYLWNNVNVYDNVQIRQSLLCDDAVVHTGATLEAGVVLSFKVVIGDNFKVPSYAMISLIPQPTEEDSSDEELEYADVDKENDKKDNGIFEKDAERMWDGLVVGDGGAGHKWVIKEGEEEWKHSIAAITLDKMKEVIAKEEEEESVLMGDSTAGAADVAADGVHDHADDDDDDDGDDDDNDDDDDGDEESDDDQDALAYFDREVEENFRRAVDGVTQENVVLEVNALRLAYNRTFADCGGAMFRAVLNEALQSPHSSTAELSKVTEALIERWGKLVRIFLKSEDDEIELLLRFEEICSECWTEFAPLFSKIVSKLYDRDVVTEDAILKWEAEKNGADESDKVFVKQCNEFIKWLVAADEEEE